MDQAVKGAPVPVSKLADALAIPTPLTGVKILLEGPTGTGKTDAIGSLVDWCARQQPAWNVNVLFTERGLETLLGYWTEPKPRNNMQARAIPPNLHWRDLVTQPVTLARMIQTARDIGQLTYEGMTKMQDMQRHLGNAWEAVLTTCSNFTSDRPGEKDKKFGAVDAWGVDTVFVIDSLSELCTAVNKMVVGSKATMQPGEYGVGQNNLMNFLRLLTQGCKCHFVLTAHVSREKDEISGGVKLMTQAIGSAISGQIPTLFSEVIYTWREASNWYWDTANPNVDLKSRYLPIESKLRPDFGQILEKWKARAAAANLVPVMPG